MIFTHPRLSTLMGAGLLALALAHPVAIAAQTAPAPASAPPSTPSAPAAYPRGPGSLTGIWMNAEYKSTVTNTARERAIRTSDGQAPPLLPAQAALLEHRVSEADTKGNIYANTISQCLPGGVPQMDFPAAYPTQIIEQAGQVTFLYEEQNHFRVIFLGGTHPADPDPGYLGHSIGHWEGDTLVVDTVGLNDRTSLDMVGTPHTEALHVVERFRRTGPTTMEVRITMDDKGAFSHPWEARNTFRIAKPGTQIGEYICENNRNSADANGFQGFGPPSK